MTAAVLHFEQGVPISDCNLDKRGHRDRMARVHHVYFQWVKNPWLDTYQLFRQMVKGQFADSPSETRAAQRDEALFRFVRDHIAPPCRAESRAKVYAAADKMIRIGMANDDVMALDKGSKRLFDVAGLDKPENEKMDMAKVMFLPPVVTTQVTDVDPNKQNVTDEQALAIINKYNAHQDGKRLAIEKRVNTMIAKRDASEITNEEENDG